MGKKPLFYYGHPGWVLLTAVAALALGWFVNTLPGSDPLPMFVLVGIGVGGLGAIMRAAAHKHDEWNWLDHLGKLLAVGAFTFAFTGAALRLGAGWEPIGHYLLWGGIGVLLVLLGGWSVVVIVKAVVASRRQRAHSGRPPRGWPHGRSRGGL